MTVIQDLIQRYWNLINTGATSPYESKEDYRKSIFIKITELKKITTNKQ